MLNQRLSDQLARVVERYDERKEQLLFLSKVPNRLVAKEAQERGRGRCRSLRLVGGATEAARLDEGMVVVVRERDEGWASLHSCIYWSPYSSCRRHHAYGFVWGYPAGESSQSSWRPSGAKSRKVHTLPSASTPRCVVKYVRKMSSAS